MAAFSNTFNKQTCTYCLEDIPGLRVNCVTCPDFTLCLQCFALGAEIGPHKNNHDYQFRDCGTLTVLSNSGWSAREELNLLEAVENYGFGNWEEIKNTFPGRSAEEVKTEFYNRFLNGSIGRVVWAEVESKRPELDDSDTFDNGPLGNEITSKLPPLDVTKEEANELGYVPLRQDFEKEYDNTAELLVSPLSINPVEDNELDIALKLAQVDMYINSLRERMRRKRVISDYQLVSKFFDSRKDKSQKKKLSREQKEFEDKFRCFAQFMTANEYNQLLSCLNREQQLKVRMTELINYRKNGLTSLEECAKFNQLKLGKSNTNKKSRAFDRSIPQFGCIRKRRKKKRFHFHRKKVHLLHRTPANIAAFNRRFAQSQS